MDVNTLQKIILAGKKVMYDPKVFPIFKAGMLKPQALPAKLSSEAAWLIKILDDKAQGQIPKNMIIPAATMLLMEMADFMVKAKLANPTKQDIITALKMLVQVLLKVYGVQAPTGAAPAQPPAQPATPPVQPPQPTAPQPVAQQTGGLLSAQGA